MKKFLLFLCIAFLIVSCSPKFVKSGQPHAKLNWIVFVDPQSNYEQMLDSIAYRKSKGIFVIDNKVFTEKAMSRGLLEYKGKKLKNIRVNLHYGTDISKYLGIARELGASHIVMAKLVTNEVKVSPDKPYEKNIIRAPGVSLDIKQRPSSKCPPQETTTQTITVKFTVLSVKTGNMVIKDEAFTKSETTGFLKGPGFLTSIILCSIVDDLIARIQSAEDALRISAVPLIQNISKYSIKQHLRVSGTLCNIRSRPSAKSAVVMQVKKGEILEKLGEAGEWCNVKLSSGVQGWINKNLVVRKVEAVVNNAIEKKRRNTTESSMPESPQGNFQRRFSQQIEYLNIKLISLQRFSDKTYRATLLFTNQSTDTKGCALAFKALYSDGIADFWKAFPTSDATLTDNLGNKYKFSSSSGLGWARTNQDWLILKAGQSAKATINFFGNDKLQLGQLYTLNFEIWFAWRDSGNIKKHNSFNIQLSDIPLSY